MLSKLRLLPLLGVNAVPLSGVFLADWEGATVLALYWWENLVGSLLLALRIAVHRALTRKRGHWRPQLNLEMRVEGGIGRAASRARRAPRASRRRGQATEAGAGSFLAEVLVAACAATALHGGLLWLVLHRVLDGAPAATALRTGVLAMAAFQLLGLGLDLVGIRERPFAWLRDLAQGTIQRVMLIHLALIAGFALGPVGVIRPFVVLKTLADLGGMLGRLGVRADAEEAPFWLVATMNRLRSDRGDFGDFWRQQREQQRRRFAEDEEVAE